MPDRCVVDTDVLSFYLRSDTRADLYDPHLAGTVIVISFMTVAELDQWALERAWGARRRADLEQYIASFAIHLPDRDLCRTWAVVSNRARRNGRPIQVADAWIAATALSLNIPLVTHNRDDYAGVDGLVVISES
jgi:predicted nucleic acid-binding protein